MKKITSISFLAAVLMAATAFADSQENLIAEGERALMAGNAIVAERAFVIGMNNYPDDTRFAYYAGIAAFYLDRPGDAERRLLTAIENYPRALFFLAMIALEAGDFEQALTRIDAYLARVPRDPDGELLKGIALLELGNTDAVSHLNLAAQLDKRLRTQALFFRGLSQFEHDDTEGADKALRAVMRLGDQPTMLQLAEQTLDVLRQRGDIAAIQWAEAYLDIIYDDNVNRELSRLRDTATDGGMRMQLRGRYWRQVVDADPTLIVGAWVDYDQPIVVDGASSRTAFGGLLDLGFYKGLQKISIDPGVEFEPSMALYEEGGSYSIALRPRLYLFQDHERSTKLFYEFKYVGDGNNGFLTGPRHVLGVRPSWTGRNRRTYVSGLLALKADSTDAAAFRGIGPKISLDAQASLPGGLLVEFSTSYEKTFYRDIVPARQEDAILGHIGVGWWDPERKFVFLVGSDQELHLNTEVDRDWRALMYWMRLGMYL